MDKDYQDMIQSRCSDVLYKIRQLLVLKEFSWNFKDADEYIRRPFPIKFL
jgi:hypothetical protein